jgi:ABC-type molybdate transport system substrate-binding protein
MGSDRTVRVRASEAVAPCVEAAAGRWTSGVGAVRVTVERGPLARAQGIDVFAGSAVEMTRAVESGAATEGSEIDLARIPWVLTVPTGNPDQLKSLEDAGRRGHEVATLSGPEAYEARRQLRAALRAERVREVAEVKSLHAAAVTLVPLSLARGERVPVDVPPLVARAAAAEGAPHAASARSFLQYLATPEGRAAFADCR